MSDQEREDFLRETRVCRVATVDRQGRPHVSPLWFVWADDSLWIYSLVKSLRWRHLRNNPAIAVVIDDGDEYQELRGVEIRGKAILSEPGQTIAPGEMIRRAEAAFGAKYSGGAFAGDSLHAWLRVVPDEIKSWDFRKIAAARAARNAAAEG